jgi:ribosomal protein L9
MQSISRSFKKLSKLKSSKAGGEKLFGSITNIDIAEAS